MAEFKQWHFKSETFDQAEAVFDSNWRQKNQPLANSWEKAITVNSKKFIDNVKTFFDRWFLDQKPKIDQNFKKVSRKDKIKLGKFKITKVENWRHLMFKIIEQCFSNTPTAELREDDINFGSKTDEQKTAIILTLKQIRSEEHPKSIQIDQGHCPKKNCNNVSPIHIIGDDIWNEIIVKIKGNSDAHLDFINFLTQAKVMQGYHDNPHKCLSDSWDVILCKYFWAVFLNDGKEWLYKTPCATTPTRRPMQDRRRGELWTAGPHRQGNKTYTFSNRPNAREF